MADNSEEQYCPDGGTCHHLCAANNCFRVGFCGPLSHSFPDNKWPEDLKFDADAHFEHLSGINDAQ